MSAPAVVIGLLIILLSTYLIVRKVKEVKRARAKERILATGHMVPLKFANDAEAGLPPYSGRHISDGNTWVNTTCEAVTLPGYLLIDRDKQIQIMGLMTSGGGGSIYHGKLLDSHLIYENDGGVEIVIKDICPQPNLNDLENKLLFQQEVAAMG